MPSLHAGGYRRQPWHYLQTGEEEIHSFTPKSYYGVRLYSEGICFTWQDQKSGSTRIFDGERAKKITEMIQGERLLLERVEKKKKHTYAPALYDLTELQRDASRRFGFSAKETLNIMQRLYEHHKVLTYPRTDSRYISFRYCSDFERACGSVQDRAFSGPCKSPSWKDVQSGETVCG